MVNACRVVDQRGTLHELPDALVAAETLLAGDATRVNARAEYWGRVEVERDQCARERDAYKAECDAARARLAAVHEALRPALEASEGATPGPWVEHESVDEGFWLEGEQGGLVSTDTGLHIWPREVDFNYMVAAANAVRAARAALGDIPL